MKSTLKENFIESKPILEMKNITKKFLGGKIIANDNISISLKKNEILSIVGENGSGKSTLMNILFGLYSQDTGNIFINGNKVNMNHSNSSSKYKIGMVHQHFHLVDKFTVLENILIGQEFVEVDKDRETKLKDNRKKLEQEIKNEKLNLNSNEKNKFNDLLNLDKKLLSLTSSLQKKYHMITLDPNNKSYISKINIEIDEIKLEKEKIEKKKNKILKGNIKKIFNIFIELEKTKFELKTLKISVAGIINKKASIRRFKKITKEYKINIMYDQIIGDLSVGDRQKVEILKVLWKEKNIVVFDEPTSTLSVEEIKGFLILVKTLQEKGVSIIFISHKLSEVKEISDRIVILNKGKFMGTFKNDSKLTVKKIANLMVGANINLKYPKRKLSSNKFLSLNNIYLKDKKTKKVHLSNVSFDVMENEIFGLAGIEGNGQEELIEVISGLKKANSGNIYYRKNDIEKESVSQRSNYMSHIPTDRFKHAIVPLMDLEFNSMITSLNDKKFSKKRLFSYDKKTKKQTNTNIFIDRTGVSKHTDKIIERLNVEGAYSHSIPMKNLSGGNQQKFVIGRELEKKHNIFLAGHPTRGLDIKAIDNIYKNIIKNSKNKATIIFSLEISELLAVCDRIAIFHNGEIVKIISPHDENQVRKISQYMVGVK